MQSKVFEGSKGEIADAIEKLNGRVIRAVVYFDETPSDLAPAEGPDEWERDLDAIMATAPANPHPADVSREAMYSPEKE
jgi:hypothetical protein